MPVVHIGFATAYPLSPQIPLHSSEQGDVGIAVGASADRYLGYQRQTFLGPDDPWLYITWGRNIQFPVVRWKKCAIPHGLATVCQEAAAVLCHHPVLRWSLTQCRQWLGNVPEVLDPKPLFKILGLDNFVTLRVQRSVRGLGHWRWILPPGSEGPGPVYGILRCCTSNAGSTEIVARYVEADCDVLDDPFRRDADDIADPSRLLLPGGDRNLPRNAQELVDFALACLQDPAIGKYDADTGHWRLLHSDANTLCQALQAHLDNVHADRQALLALRLRPEAFDVAIDSHAERCYVPDAWESGEGALSQVQVHGQRPLRQSDICWENARLLLERYVEREATPETPKTPRTPTNA